jgi:hypothetical protein
MQRSLNPVIVIGRSSKKCVRRPKPPATSRRTHGLRLWPSSPAVNGSQPTGTTPAFLGLRGEVRFDWLEPRSNAGRLSARFSVPQRTTTSLCRMKSRIWCYQKATGLFAPRNFMCCLAFLRRRSSPSWGRLTPFDRSKCFVFRRKCLFLQGLTCALFCGNCPGSTEFMGCRGDVYAQNEPSANLNVSFEAGYETHDAQPCRPRSRAQ